MSDDRIPQLYYPHTRLEYYVFFTSGKDSYIGVRRSRTVVNGPALPLVIFDSIATAFPYSRHTRQMEVFRVTRMGRLSRTRCIPVQLHGGDTDITNNGVELRSRSVPECIKRGNDK